MSHLPLDRVLQGDCIEVMRSLPSSSVDMILTDPPYLVAYRDRAGRTVANDSDPAWLKPAFAEMARLLKPGGLCISFYGWNAVEQFAAAWREADLRMVGHLTFVKDYPSSSRFLGHHHEQAYLLAKGHPPLPHRPIADVRRFTYTGNTLHPTQKPVQPLAELIAAFTRPGDVVLDPFCGSGSTLVAARSLGRHALGIELDAGHRWTAAMRLALADADREADSLAGRDEAA